MKPWISAGLALAIAGAMVGAAPAQPGGGGGGMGRMGGGGGAMRQACSADLEKLCPGVQPGGGRIGQCLREHQDQVSEGCKSALATARSRRQQMGQQTGQPTDPAPAPSEPH